MYKNYNYIIRVCNKELVVKVIEYFDDILVDIVKVYDNFNSIHIYELYEFNFIVDNKIGYRKIRDV